MLISGEMFEQTRRWVKRYARPLEVARWEYLFEGRPKEDVLSYLEAFQNDDGGFGNGLEPDFWLPKSSAIATWTAAEILFEHGISSDYPIVRKLVDYLINTYDNEKEMWLTVHPETNDYPHAPWWKWSENIQDNWMFNPSAELAGYLIHWSPEQSEGDKIGWGSVRKAISRVMDANEVDFHELNNYQQLLRIMESYQLRFETETNYSLEKVNNHVMNIVESSIDKDMAGWGKGYQALPLDLINRLDHPLYRKMKDLIDENFCFYVDNLSRNGIWDISWEWGGYPNEFAISRRYWQGILAVRRYGTFQRFGLLGEVEYE